MTTATREASGTTEDATLVAALRAGDDAAFTELFRRYSPRVTAFVRRMVGDHARAEDVTQEAFLSALRRMRATDSDIAFRPWIFEIAKNACIDSIRRSSRAEEVSIDADSGLRASDHLRLVHGGPAPEIALLAKERLSNLQGALDELPEGQGRILVMRELEGLSYREIGERLDLTRPAVESALFRARRRLEREFADLETGARCVAMGAAMARLAEGLESSRDERRLSRHIRRCSACRRSIREFGLSIEPARPLRTRVAALLPAPLVWGRRRGSVSASEGSSAGFAAGAQQGFVSWLPIVGAGAQSSGGTWPRVAAVLASAAIAGGSAVVSQTLPPAPPADGSPSVAGGPQNVNPVLAPPSLSDPGRTPVFAQSGDPAASRGHEGLPGAATGHAEAGPRERGARGGLSTPVDVPAGPGLLAHDLPKVPEGPGAPAAPDVKVPDTPKPGLDAPKAPSPPDLPSAPKVEAPAAPEVPAVSAPKAPEASAPEVPAAPSAPAAPSTSKPQLPQSPTSVPSLP